MEVWRGMAEGLSAVVINPTMILGEASHWDKGSARMIKVVYQQFPFYTEGVTGWVDVQDVARIACELMQSDIEAERFIVSGGNYAFRDIFTRMAKAMNRKPPHIKANKWMAGLVWRWNYLLNLLTGKAITVTKETAATAHRRSHYDNSKLLKAMPGFSYTPIDTTIQHMSQAYLATLKK
jgi:dihydroflavonol-4-reductase